MITITTAILIGIGCFIFGELCGVFIIALCSANKKFEEKYNEVQ